MLLSSVLANVGKNFHQSGVQISFSLWSSELNTHGYELSIGSTQAWLSNPTEQCCLITCDLNEYTVAIVRKNILVYFSFASRFFKETSKNLCDLPNPRY